MGTAQAGSVQLGAIPVKDDAVKGSLGAEKRRSVTEANQREPTCPPRGKKGIESRQKKFLTDFSGDSDPCCLSGQHPSVYGRCMNIAY